MKKAIVIMVVLAAAAVIGVFGQIEPQPECFGEGPTEAAAIAVVQGQGCIVEYTVDKVTFWQAFGYPCNDKEPCLDLVDEFLR